MGPRETAINWLSFIMYYFLLVIVPVWYDIYQ